MEYFMNFYKAKLILENHGYVLESQSDLIMTISKFKKEIEKCDYTTSVENNVITVYGIEGEAYLEFTENKEKVDLKVTVNSNLRVRNRDNMEWKNVSDPETQKDVLWKICQILDKYCQVW